MLDIAVLLVALAVVASVGAYTLLTGAPPMPTAPRVRRRMLESIPVDLTGTVMDLGSGWGGLARGLARRCPRAQVVGYERSPVPWLVSRLWQAFRPLHNLCLRWSDFRQVPLHEAALIVCYLTPPVMAELAPHLAQRLAPGAQVLSNTFALPGWRAVATYHADDIYAARCSCTACRTACPTGLCLCPKPEPRVAWRRQARWRWWHRRAARGWRGRGRDRHRPRRSRAPSTRRRR